MIDSLSKLTPSHIQNLKDYKDYPLISYSLLRENNISPLIILETKNLENLKGFLYAGQQLKTVLGLNILLEHERSISSYKPFFEDLFEYLYKNSINTPIFIQAEIKPEFIESFDIEKTAYTIFESYITGVTFSYSLNEADSILTSIKEFSKLLNQQELGLIYSINHNFDDIFVFEQFFQKLILKEIKPDAVQIPQNRPLEKYLKSKFNSMLLRDISLNSYKEGYDIYFIKDDRSKNSEKDFFYFSRSMILKIESMNKKQQLLSCF